MRHFLFLISLILLLCVPCSADTITIEVMENNLGEYFVSYNDYLSRCDNETCTFDVDSLNCTSDTMGLTSDDIKRIGQRVALEIEMPTDIGSVNESFIITTLGTNREDITDNLRAFITNTVMPTVEELDEVSNKLVEAEVTIAELQTDARDYDNLKDNKDATIATLERELKRSDYISMLCFVGILFMMLTCTNGGKDLLEKLLHRRGKGEQ